MASFDSDNCDSASAIAECNKIVVHGLTITAPGNLPCCLAALIVGIYAGVKIYKNKAQTNVMYAITFVMVGIMMLDAGFNDCILASFPWTKEHLFFLIFDVSFTSSIGIAFLFDALIDAHIIKQSACSVISFVLCVASLFVAWTYAILHQKGGKAFEWLYFGCVGIGCGSWVVVQILLVIHRRSLKGTGWLLLGALVGGFGFLAVKEAKINMFLCKLLDCYLAGDFVWFLATPIAIYFIYRYVLEVQPKTQAQFVNQYNAPFFQNPYQRGQYATINYLEMGNH
mmetsp:Transcript_8754/g.9477  ORF Transcript_8754/g.9477 Transcript_8754/m.9477 type:complete len:283 (+) Transcript_8754:49-897(+)